MIVWSYGGGVQSVAIAVLIREGALPKPDFAVIADTGREVQTTWNYLRDVVTPYLAPIGLSIAIAPHTLASRDIEGPTGLTLMPAWVKDGGRLPGYCSGTWKRDVCERWIRLQGVTECDCWIGYSLDEMWRVKADHRHWCRYTHPLIDLRLYREQCKTIIAKAGLPPADKSRCWQCPHQTPEEWQQIRERPDEWAAALAVEKAVNDADHEQTGLYLYRGRVPLEMADFAADSQQLEPLFRGCEGGSCFT